jgi:hypothetical protein
MNINLLKELAVANGKFSGEFNKKLYEVIGNKLGNEFRLELLPQKSLDWYYVVRKYDLKNLLSTYNINENIWYELYSTETEVYIINNHFDTDFNQTILVYKFYK